MNKKIGFAQATHEHGEPELNIDFDPEVYQFYKDTCAFQSQAIILRDFGFDVTQEELVDIAKTQGWYLEGYGTPLDKVGNLLDFYGVQTNITENNNIFNLANELSQGHQIIVAVDSGELWSNGVFEKLEDLFLGSRPDHALIVAGIDTSNPNDVRVILTDPGNGNFQVSYSEKQFMNAWEDSNCFMASTTQSPQEFASNGEVMFNTLDSFSGIPYYAINHLSAMSIDFGNPNYDLFFSELLSEPDNWDDLIEKYDDVFEDTDEDFDCRGFEV